MGVVLRAVLACAALLVGCSEPKGPAQTSAATDHVSIVHRNCGLRSYVGETDVAVRCLWYSNERSKRFQLPVAILSKPHERNDNTSVLVYIAGGPGDGFQTQADNLEYWLDWYGGSPLEADLLIYNPRGVPGSKPYWYCPEYDQVSLNVMSEKVGFEEEARRAAPVLHACMEGFSARLQAMDLPNYRKLSDFSTEQQARDILGILSALEYEQWHLWGVSYGTRVALKASQLALLVPEQSAKLTSQILDSPYPFNKGVLHEWAALQDNALRLHERNWAKFTRDLSLAAGNDERLIEYLTSFSSFEHLWDSVNAALDAIESEESQKGVNVHDSRLYFHVENGFRHEIATDEQQALPVYTTDHFTFYMSRSRLAALMYFVLYNASLHEQFYAALYELEQLKTVRVSPKNHNINTLLSLFLHSSFDPAFNSFAYFATECTDNPRATAADIERAISQYPAWSEYLTVMQRYDVCAANFFQKTLNTNPLTVDAKLQQPYNVSIPTLILSGENDPVTPREWAEELADTYTNSGGDVTLIRTGGGHGVLHAGWCDFSGMQAWVAHTQGTEVPDTRVAAEQRYCGY